MSLFAQYVPPSIAAQARYLAAGSEIVAGSSSTAPDVVRGRLALSSRDASAAQEGAAALRRRGFEVLGVHERGVDFQGPAARFGEVFGGRIVPSEGGARVEGTLVVPPDFPPGTESIYIPTPPQRFP